MAENTDPLEAAQSASASERLVLELTKHDRALRGYLFSLLGCQNAVDEVLQEAALTIWRKADQYDPGRPFFPWAAKFAYFKALEYRKQNRRVAPQLSQETLEQILETASEVAVESAERCQALRHCLSRLANDDRKLLSERYDKGLQVQELASARSRSRKAVYNRIDRLRLKLAECISFRMKEMTA
ncbi:MAG: sigma-70 family RNA polymerase sigma factor [Planctomycetota bacterium]